MQTLKGIAILGAAAVFIWLGLGGCEVDCDEADDPEACYESRLERGD